MLLPLALLLLNDRLKGVAKSLTLPAGMAGGSVLYWAATAFPPLAVPSAKTTAAWTIAPEFHAGTVLAFLFSFVALLINELGSVEAVGQMLGADGMGPRIRRGCGLTGVANAVAGWLGVLGPVDYSLSAGIIPASGCASRLTLIPAFAGLTVCAMFPQLIVILVSIPGPVLGGIMIYLMGLQIGSCFGILARDGGAGDFNSGVIVGLPVMVGLVVSFSPPEVFQAFPDMLRSIVGNGFVMGIVAVVLLEHVILRGKRASAE
jgi:Xanthine/uracil permeases